MSEITSPNSLLGDINSIVRDMDALRYGYLRSTHTGWLAVDYLPRSLLSRLVGVSFVLSLQPPGLDCGRPNKEWRCSRTRYVNRSPPMFPVPISFNLGRVDTRQVAALMHPTQYIQRHTTNVLTVGLAQ